MFSCELREIFKNTFYKEHLRMTASSDPQGRVKLINLEFN